MLELFIYFTLSMVFITHEDINSELKEQPLITWEDGSRNMDVYIEPLTKDVYLKSR